MGQLLATTMWSHKVLALVLLFSMRKDVGAAPERLRRDSEAESRPQGQFEPISQSDASEHFGPGFQGGVFPERSRSEQLTNQQQPPGTQNNGQFPQQQFSQQQFKNFRQQSRQSSQQFPSKQQNQQGIFSQSQQFPQQQQTQQFLQFPQQQQPPQFRQRQQTQQFQQQQNQQSQQFQQRQQGSQQRPTNPFNDPTIPDRQLAQPKPQPPATNQSPKNPNQFQHLTT